MDRPPWLAWAHELATIARAGLTYGKDPFDRERYERVQRLAAEIVGRHATPGADAVEAHLVADGGYVTPKVDVRGVVLHDGRILLVKEQSDGLWSLPGGWADLGESGAEAVVKEVREETGLVVRATKLLGVLEKSKHAHPPSLWTVYKLVFRCDPVGALDLAPSLETPDVAWFARDAIPPLSLPRVTPGQIARAFEHADDPALPTDFD